MERRQMGPGLGRDGGYKGSSGRWSPVGVEFKIGGRSLPLDNRVRRHQLEMNDLAIAVLRREISRQFKVVNEQHVVANAAVVLHQIADRAGLSRACHERGRDPALLLGFLEQ